LVEGRTVLTISHRLSTLGHVDEIIVLHKGRLAERGTYEELKDAGGVFAWLLAEQNRYNLDRRADQGRRLVRPVPQALRPAPARRSPYVAPPRVALPNGRRPQPSRTSPAGARAWGGGGLDMDVQPAATAGPHATFRVAFLNQAHHPARLTLTVRDNENRLRVRIQPRGPVVVPAQGTTTITARVVPMIGALDGEPHVYELEFRGRQRGRENTGASPLVTRARFTYVPRRAVLGPPAWSRALAGRAARLLGATLPLVGEAPIVLRAIGPATKGEGEHIT
jgi:hypothetical protein